MSELSIRSLVGMKRNPLARASHPSRPYSTVNLEGLLARLRAEQRNGLSEAGQTLFQLIRGLKVVEENAENAV